MADVPATSDPTPQLLAGGRLLDAEGKPIPRQVAAQLQRVVAGPTLAGVRPVVSGFPADGLTPHRLAVIHRAAAEGNSLAAMELAEDIEERDLHYVAVLGTRRRQVAQLPIVVEAASEDPEHKRHAQLITDWMQTGVLEEALFDMQDAIGKGFSVHEIDWEVTATSILPRGLIYRSPRWFEVSRADGETVMLRELEAEPPAVPIQTGFAGTGDSLYPGQIGLLPLAPHKFVVHKTRAKSGILARAGLARIASWAWMLKAFTQRDWTMFVQNYGMPIRVGRYGPESTFEERDVLWTAVANIAGDCAAIIPRSMEIEFVKAEGTMAAAELYQKRCDWLDQQVSKAVLGQTTTTDAIGGGHAVAREHRLVQEDIERADARSLSLTLSRQLLSQIIAFNFPAYVAGGGRAFPRIAIGRPDEVPIEQVVTALQWLGPQGLTVKTSQIRERLNFEEPEDGDDVVGGKPPPPPAPIVSPPQLRTQAEPGRGPGPAPAPGGKTNRARRRRRRSRCAASTA